MKIPLTISIFLNGALLAALGIASAHHQNATSLPVSSIAPSIPGPETKTAPSFQWSQLESTNDYRTYVTNLRAIGCPESTIRAIVTADFEAAASFAQHRLQVAGESTSQFSPVTTKQAIASVLGNDTAQSHPEQQPEAFVAAADTFHRQPSPLHSLGKTVARASYPVVFQNAVQNDHALTENQKAAVRQLQQQFVDAVGGPDQNPADPAYSARWSTAQQDADDALRAQLGDQAYLSYQMQHYYSNFQQVILNAGEGPITINPDALAK